MSDGEEPTMGSCEEAAGALVASMQTVLQNLKSSVAALALPSGSSSGSDKENVHLNLLCLRKGNRAMSTLVREKKRRVQKAKSALDRAELARHNVLYQRDHLRASIDDARQHESLYLQVLQGQGEAKEEASTLMELDEHELILHRLQRELEGRRQLAEKLKANQESLELAKSRLVLKRKEMERMLDQVEGIIKAADPFLHSHARLFADLKQRSNSMQMEEEGTTASEEGTHPPPSLPGEEAPSRRGSTALEVLWQHLLEYAEGKDDVILQYVDEIEPGEDVGEVEEGQEDGGRDANVDADADVEADEGEEPTEGEAGNSGSRGRSRFAAHSHRRTSLHPEHVFAHISVRLQCQSRPNIANSPGPDGEDEIRLRFLAVAQGALIAVQPDLPATTMNRAAAESHLLALPLEPAMLLTLSHEAVVPGEAGYVPFRWIQCLAGLAPSDSAFADPAAVLGKFFSALREAKEEASLQFRSHRLSASRGAL